MRILHILDERWDSAITEYGLSLAVALKEQGHDVRVAAPPGLYAYREAENRGLPVHSLKSLWRFRRWVKREGIQVINAHTGTSHFWGWWARWGRPVGLVRTRGDARSMKRTRSHALLYRRTDAVVGASRLITSHYKALYPFLSNLRTIYPGLKISPPAPEPEGPLSFALVGRLDPIKGHIYFIEAIAHIKNHLQEERFIITGEEKDTKVSGLRRAVEKCGVARWVQILGRQPDITAFMGSCHVGVSCSIGSEALSRVCLEWMAQGRPVVATAVGCLPELINTGENGFLVPAHGSKSLGDCFLGMIKNPALRREMGARARATAQARFSLDRFVGDTEKVYEEVLKMVQKRSS